jgi:hypothetical protein
MYAGLNPPPKLLAFELQTRKSYGFYRAANEALLNLTF